MHISKPLLHNFKGMQETHLSAPMWCINHTLMIHVMHGCPKRLKYSNLNKVLRTRIQNWGLFLSLLWACFLIAIRSEVFLRNNNNALHRSSAGLGVCRDHLRVSQYKWNADLSATLQRLALRGVVVALQQLVVCQKDSHGANSRIPWRAS